MLFIFINDSKDRNEFTLNKCADLGGIRIHNNLDKEKKMVQNELNDIQVEQV